MNTGEKTWYHGTAANHAKNIIDKQGQHYKKKKEKIQQIVDNGKTIFHDLKWHELKSLQGTEHQSFQIETITNYNRSCFNSIGFFGTTI